MKRIKLTGWGWAIVLLIVTNILYAAISSASYARGYERGYRDGQYWGVDK